MLDFLTSKEAAQELNLSQGHVALLCARGDLWGAHKVAKTWLIPINSVKFYKKLRSKKS